MPFLIVLLMLLADLKLSIRVTPTVLMEGDSIHVMCRVPLKADNRRLQMAIEDYVYSERPIDGAYGPVTTELTFSHIPCDAHIVSCTVMTATRSITRVTQSIEVVCQQ